MHISEGVLEAKWCIAGYAAAAPLVGYALKTLDRDDIPRVSVVGAAFFAASLVHVRIGLSSVHLTLIGLAGLLLGRQAVPAILTGLFFQGVMFQHGGLSTLGLNTFTMGSAALLARGAFVPFLRVSQSRTFLLSFSGAVIAGGSILVAALLVAAILVISTAEYAGLAAVFSVANLVVAGVEGLATFFIIGQILRVKPELLYGH